MYGFILQTFLATGQREQIVDAGTRHSKSLKFRQIIEEFLRRQQAIGFPNSLRFC